MKQLLKYILSLNLEHQKIAETKHSITVALSSGVIVVLVGLIGTDVGLSRLFCFVAIFLCIVSILFSFIALSSKSIVIKSKRQWNKKDANLTYFKHISKLDFEEFKNSILIKYNFPYDYKVDCFETDLIKQIIATSKRVNSKYNIFNISIWFLFLGLIFSFLSVSLNGVLW